jgi:hypothetical protein
MTQDELALKIGRHVLMCFDDFMKSPFGTKASVPVTLPRGRSRREFQMIYPNFSDWILTVDVSAPTIMMRESATKFRDLSVKEFFELTREAKSK